jgi:hypothetical protein
MKAASTILETIIVVVILAIFAGIILTIYYRSYIHSLPGGGESIPSTNVSAPIACQINVTETGGSSSSCTVRVTAEGGTDGVDYALYGPQGYMCSYIAGYGKCVKDITIPGSATFICNTSGKSISNITYSPGGASSFYFICS